MHFFFPPPHLQVRELDFGIENVGRKKLILARRRCLKATDADQCEVSPHFLKGVSERSPPSPPLSAVMLTEKFWKQEQLHTKGNHREISRVQSATVQFICT